MSFPTVIRIFLPSLFSVHTVLFLALGLKRRQAYYFLASLAFLFLTIASLLRYYAPGLELMHIQSYWFPRILAWGILWTMLAKRLMKYFADRRSPQA